MNNFDKVYHLLGAFPQTQIYVGGFSALRHGIALIKDVALICIFRTSPEQIDKWLTSLVKTTIASSDTSKQSEELYIKTSLAAFSMPDQKLLQPLQDSRFKLNLWTIGLGVMIGVDPKKHLDGFARGIITATPMVGTAYSLYQLGRYWVVPKYITS